MPTVADQIKLEQELSHEGQLKYFQQQDKFKDTGMFQETDAVSSLVTRAILNVAEQLQKIGENSSRGIGGKYNGLVKKAASRVGDDGEIYPDYNVMAYIGLQCAFQAQTDNKRHQNRISSLAMTIASRLETDLKCTMFEAAHPAYYSAVMQSFADSSTTNYRHRAKTLMMMFNKFELEWEDWSELMKAHVGVRVIRAILLALPDVFFINTRMIKGNNTNILDLTPDADDWIAEFEQHRSLLEAWNGPTIIKPLDWQADENNNITGGYYTDRARQRVPFIKTTGEDTWVRENVPHDHIKAVNKLQEVPWEINPDILTAQETCFQLGLGLPSPKPIELIEFPERLKKEKDLLTEDELAELEAWKDTTRRQHTQNRQRKGQVIQYLRILQQARRYSEYEAFHFVYTCDFRGRVYCATNGLSPQGEDAAKSLLRFKTAKPIGHSGIRWLAVHGANTFGFDKSPLPDRVQFITDREDAIRLCVEDPTNGRLWLEADKPWQFLAFCFEWAATDFGRNPDADCHLPIGLDGSCNGLQHYGAILRDTSTAEATNLTIAPDGAAPSDIYGRVAEVSAGELRDLDTEVGRKWLDVGVNRKLAKRPVMTLPYGATQQSARSYVYEYAHEHIEDFNCSESDLWGYVKYYTPILWNAIGQVVVAARAGMDWIQAQTSKIVRQSPDGTLRWLTPLGFPVIQQYRQYDQIRINTQLMGRCRISFNVAGSKPDYRRQRNGIAPNFIHSLDSTHMIMVINNTDFDGYAMIHDDFGTHACDTERMYSEIRKQFHRLYVEHEPLQEWYDQQPLDESDRATLPSKGDYNIDDILESTYFFC